MVRNLFFLLMAVVFGCSSPEQKPASPSPNQQNNLSFRLYSPTVGDTFTISVSMPEGEPGRRYPVVYLLDANLYFEPMAAICRRYAEVGLLPPVVLVGVGYKNFTTMDSLRSRDYTFPVGLPEYEMPVSGGADKFARFLGEELPARLHDQIPMDSSRRVLMGHSLGGYYTLLHLWKDGQGEVPGFNGYIAASPSLDYNHNYLLQAFKKAGTGKANTGVFVTFGGLEDSENKGDPSFIASGEALAQLRQSIGQNPAMRIRAETYSNLGHMDTPLITFTKGLQEILMKEEENGDED